MSNFWKRLLTGIIYVATVIAAVSLNSVVTAAYFFVVAMIGLWEFYHNSEKKNIFPNYIIGFLIAWAIYSLFLFYDHRFYRIYGYFPYVVVFYVTILLFIALFVWELFRKKEQPFTNIAYTILGTIYIVVPFALTNWFVNLKGNFDGTILLSVFIFAWCNDTFAYLTGMKFGKHKLFERISPHKTWEGSIGGFIFTILAGIIMGLCTNDLDMVGYIVVAMIVSVVGTLGDLVESMFKRQIEIKDSGKILPGHGGILDRFDILLICLPIVFVFIVFWI